MTSLRSKETTDAILHELLDRSGFDAWWEEIGSDNRDDIEKAIAWILTRSYETPSN